MRAIAVCLFLSACGTSSSSLPAGAECSDTSECGSGLMCLGLGQFSGSTCTTVAKTCTITCQDDTTCAPLGSGFKCFADCDGGKVCGATP